MYDKFSSKTQGTTFPWLLRRMKTCSQIPQHTMWRQISESQSNCMKGQWFMELKYISSVLHKSDMKINVNCFLYQLFYSFLVDKEGNLEVISDHAPITYHL